MTIVGDDAQLELDIIRKEYSQSDNEEDQQWLEVNIKASLTGFMAYFEASVRIDEFNLFIDSISNVLDTQKGTVELFTMEESICLRGIVDATGNVDWTGVLTYPVGIGDKLQFRFNTDFYQLQRIKDGLTKDLLILSQTVNVY